MSTSQWVPARVMGAILPLVLVVSGCGAVTQSGIRDAGVQDGASAGATHSNEPSGQNWNQSINFHWKNESDATMVATFNLQNGHNADGHKTYYCQVNPGQDAYDVCSHRYDPDVPTGNIMGYLNISTPSDQSRSANMHFYFYNGNETKGTELNYDILSNTLGWTPALTSYDCDGRNSPCDVILSAQSSTSKKAHG